MTPEQKMRLIESGHHIGLGERWLKEAARETADAIEGQRAIRAGVMAQLQGVNDIIASLENMLEQQRLTILDRDAVITERDATIERMAKAITAGQRENP